MNFIKKNIKAILIVIMLLLFQEIVYFGTKLMITNQINLSNSFDDKIPFIPEFVHFYYIWYVLLFSVPLIALKHDKQNFNNYVISCFTFIIIEFFMFIIFPTTLTRYQFDVNSFSTWVVDVVYKSDTPVYNIFPSGHCAYSLLFILTTIYIKNMNKILKSALIVTSIGIILSTIFIKQHVVIDVIGAFAIVIPLYYFIKNKNIDLERTKIYATIFRKR